LGLAGEQVPNAAHEAFKGGGSMRLSLSYEMQRPVVDDHAVIEETIEQCVLADKISFDAVRQTIAADAP
jgi:hypothetical protein